MAARTGTIQHRKLQYVPRLGRLFNAAMFIKDACHAHVRVFWPNEMPPIVLDEYIGKGRYVMNASHVCRQTCALRKIKKEHSYVHTYV